VSTSAFYAWINSIRINQVEKRDIYIRLLDEVGSPVISWLVINAFPVALIAPNFSASSNEVAIEQMNLMADRIAIEEA
ncbi:MAG: phage tail protein, partial [Bacteroidota bacterium]